MANLSRGLGFQSDPLFFVPPAGSFLQSRAAAERRCLCPSCHLFSALPAASSYGRVARTKKHLKAPSSRVSHPFFLARCPLPAGIGVYVTI